MTQNTYGLITGPECGVDTPVMIICMDTEHIYRVTPLGDHDHGLPADHTTLHEIIRRANAAPELLAALEEIKSARDYYAQEGVYPEKIHVQYQCCFDDWAADVADDAIARATGKGE